MAKRSTIVVVSLAALALVGFIGFRKEPVNHTQADDHPCQRVTIADLETVVPAPVAVQRREIANGGRICRWSYPLPAGRTGPATALWPTSIIEVGVWQGRRYYVPDAVGEEFTAVPGIADAAHVDWPRFITFRKGETVVVIENREGFDLRRQSDVELPRWRALAALVASRY